MSDFATEVFCRKLSTETEYSLQHTVVYLFICEFWHILFINLKAKDLKMSKYNYNNVKNKQHNNLLFLY